MLNDHTGHPPTSLSNLPRDSFDQEQQDRLADLRSQLAAAEADRATWQQRATVAEERLSKATRLWGEWARRATSAEAERNQLRGEALALREALSYDGEDWADVVEAALNATPRSAQLGALVEAAVTVAVAEKRYRAAKRNGERDEALAQLHEANDRLIEIADGLASEVRT